MSSGDRVERHLFIRTFLAVRPPLGVTEELSDLLRDVYFSPGQNIYEAGGPASDLFFVAHGTVELRAPDREPWVFSDGSVVGILDVLANRPRARTAVALTDVHILQLRAEDWFEVLEDHFDYARQTVRVVSGQLHQIGKPLPDGGFRAPELQSLAARPRTTKPLNFVDRLIVIRACPVCRGMPTQGLSLVAELAVEERVPAGHTLFAPGEASTHLYFVVEGRVRLESEPNKFPKVEAWFGPGHLVGAHYALGQPQELYRAVVTEPSILLKVNEEQLFDVTEDHPEMIRALFAYLALEREHIMIEIGRQKAQSGERPVRP